MATVAGNANRAPGTYGPFGPFAVPSTLDSADVTVVPGSNWATDALGTVFILVEQSLDGGANWQHWVDSGLIRTGPLPRSGVISFGITNTYAGARQVRVSLTIGGRSVRCAFTIDITRRSA